MVTLVSVAQTKGAIRRTKGMSMAGGSRENEKGEMNANERGRKYGKGPVPRRDEHREQEEARRPGLYDILDAGSRSPKAADQDGAPTFACFPRICRAFRESRHDPADQRMATIIAPFTRTSSLGDWALGPSRSLRTFSVSIEYAREYGGKYDDYAHMTVLS